MADESSDSYWLDRCGFDGDSEVGWVYWIRSGVGGGWHADAEEAERRTEIAGGGGEVMTVVRSLVTIYNDCSRQGWGIWSFQGPFGVQTSHVEISNDHHRAYS